MSTHTRTALGLAALGAISAFAGFRPALASERDFPFTYDWSQAAQGEQEIETRTTLSNRGTALAEEVEFEYGITRRLAIAPYITFKKAPGDRFRYDAVKLETRYQLGDYQTDRVLPGLYLEYEKAHDEPAELEGKLILSRYGKNGSDLSLNVIYSRSASGGGPFKRAFSVGYAQPLVGRGGQTRGGVELIHDLDSGRTNAGPVIALPLGGGHRLVAGYAFALNRRNDNNGELRLLTEYEF